MWYLVLLKYTSLTLYLSLDFEGCGARDKDVLTFNFGHSPEIKEPVLEYMSLIGAVSSVIAATYAALAYYRMQAEDSPTLHVRLLEPVGEGEYNLVLEVHPGKRPARYKALSIRGGYIGSIKYDYAGNILEDGDASDFRRYHKTDIFVPPCVARDQGPDLSLMVRMKSSAVISLHTRRIYFCRKLSIWISGSMAEE